MSTQYRRKQWCRVALVGLGMTLGCEARKEPAPLEGAAPPEEQSTPPADTGEPRESPAEVPPVVSGPQLPGPAPEPPASFPKDARRAWWRGSTYAGVAPEALAVGDVDGDGDADIIVGLRDRKHFEDQYMAAPGWLRVLRNEGKGRLVSTEARQALPATMARVVAGDVNADGRTDVFAGTEYGARVLAGQADGSLEKSTQQFCTGAVTHLGIWKGPTGAPLLWSAGYDQDFSPEGFCVGHVREADRFEQWRPLEPFVGRESAYSATVGDFNEDGFPDVLLGHEKPLSSEGQARLFLSDGAGGLVRGVSFPLMPAFQGISSADFNHDGHLDMLGHEPGSLSVWLGTGQGGFTFVSRHDIGNGEPSMVDLDGDVFPDVVVLSAETDTASLWRGSEAGPLRSWGRITVGRWPLAAASADLNGDGTPELLVAEANANTVSVYEVPREPTVEPRVPLACPVDAAVPPLADVPGKAALASLDVGGSAVRGGSGDFDGDGREDLAFALARGGVQWVLHADEGRPPFREIEPVQGLVANSLAVGDFDGDGRADVAADLLEAERPPGDPIYTTVVLWNDASLSFTQSQVLRDRWWMAYELLAGDFNGDGLVDLAAAQLDSSGQGSYGIRYTSLGQKEFRSDGLHEHNGSRDGIWGSANGLPRAADFNGDGTLDLVYLSRGINIVPTSAQGTTLASAGHGFAYGVGSFFSATDVDGDGKADLVTSRGSGFASLMRGDGHGSVEYPLQCVLPAGERILAWEDLDANGTADLVTTSKDGKRLWVVPRTKQGAWAAAEVRDLDSGVSWVRSVDLLGDRRPELVVMLQSGRLLVLPTPGA